MQNSRKLTAVAVHGVLGAGIVAALLPGAAVAADANTTKGVLYYDVKTNVLTYEGTDAADSTWVESNADGGKTVVFSSTAPYDVLTTSACDKDPLNAQVTRCTGYPGTARLRIDINLGGGADSFTSRTPLAGVVDGADGNDVFQRHDVTPYWGRSSLEFHGGEGTDTIDYRAQGAGVTVSLDDTANDGVPGDTDNIRTDVEKFHGTVHADRFYGDTSSETFLAYGGDDFVYADGGNDTIRDTGGDDTLQGGDGNDTITVDGSANIDHVYGGGGSDTIDAVNGHVTSIHCGEGGATDNDIAVSDARIDSAAGDCETVTRI